MSITQSESRNQQYFGEKLAEVQEWLVDRSIEYRIIGSLATAAYLDPFNASSISFDRKYATTPEDRVPDIDLIVPRDSLTTLRNYRETQLASPFPVSLGLSFPSRFIDMRPDSEISFLGSSKRIFPVHSVTLDGVKNELLDQEIVTPNLTTLYFIHKMVGPLRQKDVVKVSELERRADLGDPNFANYKEFSEYRSTSPGLMGKIEKRYTRLNDNHPNAARRIHKAVLPIASLIGAR